MGDPKFQRARDLLLNRNIMNEFRDFNYSYNRVKFHNKYETIEHFITKALLSFLIGSKEGNSILSEAEMRNARVLDVLQITKSKQLVAYEVESNGINKKEDIEGVDFITVDLNKMPEKAREGLKALESWVKDFIV